MSIRAKFTKADIKRAFSGALAAGIASPKIEIDQSGKIVIMADHQKRTIKDDGEWADLD